MRILIERAKRANVRLRINYRSDGAPTVHIECSTSTYALELTGDIEELEEMCAAMYDLLEVVDPSEQPF